MTIAKEAFDVLEGARTSIKAEQDAVMQANASLAGQPLIPAAIGAADRMAFAFALGSLVGQVLHQYPVACMRAFFVGVKAGRAAVKIMSSLKVSN